MFSALLSSDWNNNGSSKKVQCAHASAQILNNLNDITKTLIFIVADKLRVNSLAYNVKGIHKKRYESNGVGLEI